MVCEAVATAFPQDVEPIMRGFVEMLTFDALIGHNDRHPYNWAIVVPLRKNRAPRFSPVYDTARALFWNKREPNLQQMLTDNRQLEMYIKRCEPPICWDEKLDVDYFGLISLIWRNYPQYRSGIEKFVLESPLTESLEIIDREFHVLMSETRREIIKRCLTRRHECLREAIATVERK